jgi:hypothetical protein
VVDIEGSSPATLKIRRMGRVSREWKIDYNSFNILMN